MPGGEELLQKIQKFDTDANGVDLQEFEKGIKTLTEEEYKELGKNLATQNNEILNMLTPALDIAQQKITEGGEVSQKIKNFLMYLGKIEEKEIVSPDTYEYKDGKYFLNGKEQKQPINIQNTKEVNTTVEITQAAIMRFEKIFDALSLFTNMLQIQVSDKDNALSNTQRKQIQRTINVLSTQLANKEKYKQESYNQIADYTEYSKYMNGLIDMAIPQGLINDFGKLGFSSGENIYQQIKDQIKNILLASDDGPITYQNISGNISVLGRKMIGRNGSDMLLPNLEDYILHNSTLKHMSIPQTTTNNVPQMTSPIGNVQEMFVNIIQPKIEQDGDTKIVDDYIAAINKNKITSFISTLWNSNTNQETQKFNNLPPKLQALLIFYLQQYGKKFIKKIEKQKEEIIKTTKKQIGMQLYMQYLQTNPQGDDKTLLNPGNEKKLTQRLESMGDDFAQYGTFKVYRSSNSMNALWGIENKFLQNNNQALIKKQNDIYQSAKRTGACQILKSAFTRAIITSYQTEITDKDAFGLQATKIDGKFSGAADFIKKAYALQKKGVDFRIQGATASDNKIATYIDIVGVGAFNLSDKAVDSIVYWTKEVAIQVALIAVSGGLANIATKGLMLIGSKVLTAIKIGGYIQKLSLAERVALYYREAQLLNTVSRIGIGATDLAIEGSLFHVFNTLLGGAVNKQSWDEIGGELTNVRSYAHSIAYIGVMRGISALSRLGTTEMTKSFSILIEEGKMNTAQVQNIMKGISLPLEIGTMASTDLVINFAQSALTGEKMRPVDLINIMTIVIGLRIAHAGGNPFKKGEEIIIKHMEIKEGKIINLQFEKKIKQEIKNKKEVSVETNPNILYKPFDQIVLKERENMGFNQQREYIKKNELWKDESLSFDKEGKKNVDISKKQTIEDLTLEEFSRLIENIQAKKLAEKNFKIDPAIVIKNAELNDIDRIIEAKKLPGLNQDQAIIEKKSKLADLGQLEISFKKKYEEGVLIKQEVEGSRNLGVYVFEGKIVKLVKDKRTISQNQINLMNEKLYDLDNVFNPIHSFALSDGISCIVMDIAPGKDAGKLTTQEINTIPSQHRDKFEQTVRVLSQRGVMVDLTKRSNFFYDQEKGFQFLDIEGMAINAISTHKFFIKEGKEYYYAFEKYRVFPKEYTSAKDLFVTIKKQENTKQINTNVDQSTVESNSALNDIDRIIAAKKLPGLENITPAQEQAIIEAHKQSGEIYNLDFSQIRARLEILKKAKFTSEQIRTLMENGICGQKTRERIINLLNPIKDALLSGKLDVALSTIEKIAPSEDFKLNNIPGNGIDALYTFVDSYFSSKVGFEASDVTFFLSKLKLLKDVTTETLSLYTEVIQKKIDIYEVTNNARLVWSKRIEKGYEIIEKNGVTIDANIKEIMHKAIMRAHAKGSSQPGKNGESASIYNYTIKQLGEKMYILMDAMQKCGIEYTKSKDIAKELLRNGICGQVKVLPENSDGNRIRQKYSQNEIETNQVKNQQLEGENKTNKGYNKISNKSENFAKVENGNYKKSDKPKQNFNLNGNDPIFFKNNPNLLKEYYIQEVLPGMKETDIIKQKIMQDIVNQVGGETKNAPLKGIDSKTGNIDPTRAIEKIIDEYYGNVNKLLDISRGTLVYDNIDGVYKAFDMLLQHPDVVSVFVKDNFQRKTGYRDINLAVTTYTGKTFELQTNTKKLLESKENGLIVSKDYINSKMEDIKQISGNDFYGNILEKINKNENTFDSFDENINKTINNKLEQKAKDNLKEYKYVDLPDILNNINGHKLYELTRELEVILDVQKNPYKEIPERLNGFTYEQIYSYNQKITNYSNLLYDYAFSISK